MIQRQFTASAQRVQFTRAQHAKYYLHCITQQVIDTQTTRMVSKISVGERSRQYLHGFFWQGGSHSW